MPQQILHLKIDAMSCQACASRIEKVLNKKDFIYQVYVNFADEKAQIIFEDSIINTHDIIKIIEKIGFKAHLVETTTTETQYPIPWRIWLLLVLSMPFILGMIGMIFNMPTLMPSLWLQIILASIAQSICALPFYRSAWASIRGRLANMDVLVSCGTLIIYLYSLAITLFKQPYHVYFEASVMILCFVSLGKYLESRTKRHSLNALNLLLQLTPQQVNLVCNGSIHNTALTNVQIGNILIAVAGERIAADGIIVSGEAWLNESHLTGESQTLYKHLNDKVLAGSLVQSGSIHYRAEQLGQYTLLGDMMQALAEAQGSKAPISRIADRVAHLFVPSVGIISLFTWLLTWWITGDCIKGIIHATSVLVVACPCALGLATPAAIMAGMGVAVKHGIRFKNAATLERAGQINTVVFDKTGTLTLGKPHLLASWSNNNYDENQLLSIAAAVEQHSRHPLAHAIIQCAKNQNISIPNATHITDETGSGLQANINGIGTVRIGKPEYCNLTLPENLLTNNNIWSIASIVGIAINNTGVGALAFADAIKPNTFQAIEYLHHSGVEIHIMSGDRQTTVQHIAQQLNINHAQGNMSPRDKTIAIQNLMTQGKTVAMLGDGINDAAALAIADVGFAVYGSTAAAEHSADVIFMRPDTQQITDALLIARATLTNIRQNLFAAFIYNILCIPLAALGFLNPVLAGAAMALSSISVLGNALRLKKFKP